MGLFRKLDVFNKERICAHLAKMDVPVRPAYELRKVTMLGTADSDRYRCSLYRATESPREVTDPPTDYFDQWRGYNGFTPNDALMERLTDNDEALLYGLLGLEDGHLYFVARYTDKFDACCKVLGESEQKPAWDLVRVIATDTLGGYHERQEKYEQLLSFELGIKILKGQVIELAKGIYQLPKTLEISNKDDLHGYSGYIQLIDLLGYRLRDHWMNEEETANGLTRIALEHGIEDIIEDALIRGELPIYQPILKKVDYSSHDRGKDLVFWPELKFVLEQKTDRTYPYHPFIENDRPEVEHVAHDNADNQAGSNQMPIQINGNETEYSGLLKTPKRINEWFKVIYDMTRSFMDEYKIMPNEAQAWAQLYMKPPAGYEITAGKDKGGEDCLTMPGERPLSKSAFSKRWANYTNKGK